MTIRPKLSATLLCAASVLALTAAARAQETNTETVVVTGSRVISDAANSPTPLTVVTTAQLQATTPTDISDALNKLPIFQGSNTPRLIVNASTDSGQNTLNLLSYGSQRTLVLLDGHRVTPSNANGTVDADSLPSMLVSRVDVVLGGASAVYGSDAVTGVVNYVLDKHFNGIKADLNAGLSGYADGLSYKTGVAAGSDLFGGRGHFEVAAQHFHQDGIQENARPQGLQSWNLYGTGTVANPYVSTDNGNFANYAYGGYVTCTGCSANGKQFFDGAVLGPWNPGQTTGTAGDNKGGDGVTTLPSIAHITSSLSTDDIFGRFSYNLDDTTTAYVQVAAAQADNKAIWQEAYIRSGNAANLFFGTNAYLPAAAQAALTNGTSSIFQLTEYIADQGPDGMWGAFQTNGLDRSLSVNAGLDGTLLGKYDWDVYYNHGESRQKVSDPTNQNNDRMFAAEDAVLNSAGNVVCYVSTTANASRYPGCVPMNPFGRNAMTGSQYQYFVGDTHYIMTNVLDDVEASMTGDVFDLPAGPVKAALSGEMRWLSYEVASNAPPAFVDCTGLRLCNSAVALWQANTVAPQPLVSENVWEIAGEVNVPLLKDAPLTQSLDLDLAGRYTEYSNSGTAPTWKIGLDDHINDTIRLRATTSINIRAPTLNDLFSPLQQSHSPYNDIHTATSTTELISSQGNANLVPEVARTYTAGIVLTPSFIPGLTASLDWYNIKMKNAIGSISGNSVAVEQLCEASGGTSPYCALFVRPLPFSNTTAANVPTQILSESLNTALNQIEGLNMELDYGFEMSSIVDSIPGSVTLRTLANIQDMNETQTYPNAAVSMAVAPKEIVTSLIGYKLGDWSFNLENKWISGAPKAAIYGQVYLVPRVPNRDYIDLTVTKKFTIDDNALDAYLSVQNVANTQPPVNPNQNAAPGLYYMGSFAGTYDAVGRYFTLGLRASL